QELRSGAIYRVPTKRARAFAAALREAGILRYAEPDAPLTRQSALDGAPSGYARGFVVEPGLSPPAPGTVSIAVVDDRVDISHPDLAGHTRQLNPGPVLGAHGTQVASAAAASFNGFGVVGVFPGAPILSVGLPPDIRCSSAAEGVLAAADRGAKVINLSFGSTSDCATMFGAVQIAFARGSLVVAAAGNEFGAGNPVVFPAAYPHVLSVASLNSSLRPSAFSSANAAIDVAAPGDSIPLATPLAFDTEDGVVDGVTTDSGTSFAAPIVSGAAGWLATARRGLSNGQLADVLRRSARDVAPAGYDANTGFGLVNMAAALALPAPARDVLEPNDGISFVDGSVFSQPDPYVWRGSGRRTLGGSADKVEDPYDVYRIRLPRRSRARIRLRPAFGNPDLYVFGSSARSIDDVRHIVARSRKGTLKIDAVTIRNASRYARRYYVGIGLGNSGGGLNAEYNLQFQRTQFR
ncbi:MAG TPA: S8 family serine peptidase, partial [Solirubrobacteraceae bacterium]|nr:S8 family serine peptidase [Solirubrobacteraceae bacterium]